MSRFTCLVILCLSFAVAQLPATASAGFYDMVGESGFFELMSSASYSLFTRKTCPAIAPNVEQGFLEHTRADLEENIQCTVGKLEAAWKKPELLKEYLKVLRDRVPELIALKALEKKRYEEASQLSLQMPVPSGLRDSRRKIRTSPEFQAQRQAFELKAKEYLETQTLYETLMATVPFTQNTKTQYFIEHLTPKNLANDTFMIISLTRLFRALEKTYREQLELVRPGKILGRTAREDIIQDRPYTKRLLKEYAAREKMDDQAREALTCQLEARYGTGSEYLNNTLIAGSFLIAMEYKGLSVGGKALVGGLKTARSFEVPMQSTARVLTKLGSAVRNTAIGYILVDSIRDFERMCSLNSPNHVTHKGPNCGGEELIEELYELDCASFFGYYALGINASRTSKAVVNKSLIDRFDRQGIFVSRIGLNYSTFQDQLTEHFSGEPAKKKKIKNTDEAAKTGQYVLEDDDGDDDVPDSGKPQLATQDPEHPGTKSALIKPNAPNVEH